MKIKILLVLLPLCASCQGVKRIIDGPSTPDIPACSRVTPLDVTLSDTAVMDALYFDQRVRLDSSFQFFDSRGVDYVRMLYNHARPFPSDAGGLACLDEPRFRRAVEASNNLGRFPLVP